jgi:hypothetical protein
MHLLALVALLALFFIFPRQFLKLLAVCVVLAAIGLVALYAYSQQEEKKHRAEAIAEAKAACEQYHAAVQHYLHDPVTRWDAPLKPPRPPEESWLDYVPRCDRIEITALDEERRRDAVEALQRQKHEAETPYWQQAIKLTAEGKPQSPELRAKIKGMMQDPYWVQQAKDQQVKAQEQARLQAREEAKAREQARLEALPVNPRCVVYQEDMRQWLGGNFNFMDKFTGRIMPTPPWSGPDYKPCPAVAVTQEQIAKREQARQQWVRDEEARQKQEVRQHEEEERRRRCAEYQRIWNRTSFGGRVPGC